MPAAARGAPGVSKQLGALAFALLPLLNGLTTGQGLNHSLGAHGLVEWIAVSMAGVTLWVFGMPYQPRLLLGPLLAVLAR